MTKYQDLIAGIKRGPLKPLYLFYGDEPFQMQEAVDLIVEKVVDPAARDFNFNTVYPRETSPAELISLCQTLPFMTEKRLVIVKGFETIKASDIEELILYFEDPSPSTCLVMQCNPGKYDKKSVIAAIEAHGIVTRFYGLLDREVVPEIERRVRSKGLTIQNEAAQFLYQALGNDFQMITNELEKVLIFIQGRKSITYDDVKTIVGNFREYTSFDLAAAVGRKDREQALLILSRLIQEGEAPVGLLGAIAWNFRRLTMVKSMVDSGIAADDAMKRIRPPVIFHQAAQFKQQMKNYSLDELREVFAAMLVADRSLKSSGLQGRLVLEQMILRLCGPLERQSSRHYA